LKYLLDTNVVISALNGNQSIVDHLNALADSDQLIMCIIVVAELKYGAMCSSRRDDNLARIEKMLKVFKLVSIDLPVATRFAKIKAMLRDRGIVKSDADLLIASTALVTGAVLVTGDNSLLDGTIPDLKTRNWLT